MDTGVSWEYVIQLTEEKLKRVGVVAYNDEIFYLIEANFNKYGKSDAWVAIMKSLSKFLQINRN